MGMKKKFIFGMLLVALPLFFFIVVIFGAYAQEGETPGGEAVVEKNSDRLSDSKDEKANEGEETEAVKRENLPEKKEVIKKQEKAVRKKKEIKREAEKPAEKNESEKMEHETEIPAGEIERSVVEGLLLIDHERIRHNRIPGYKPPEEGAEKPIVSIPEDDSRKDVSQNEDKQKGGIFGKNTGAIAGWGLLVIIFIIFAIYSKTRGRAGRRRVVRNYPKR